LIVRGVDFTSRPSRRKPITCFEGQLEGATLRFMRETAWTSFEGFEDAIAEPGPWIAGLDLPFGQARRFVEAVGWPRDWTAYTQRVASLSREEFRAELDRFRLGQPPGAKEFRRETDRQACAVSPQKLHGVPVALMFFEGIRRLIGTDVAIPGLKPGNRQRIAVEAYPGVMVRGLVGRRPYKNDDPKKQSPDHQRARRDILDLLANGAPTQAYRIALDLPGHVADAIAADGSGDRLDAMLCAIQAAWAWTMRDEGFGAPAAFDPLEGWIADPSLLDESFRP
jgi:hypothetical protein